MQSVPSFDLYRELEVDPAATPETIEAAWRSLVKRHHPDVAGDRVAAVTKIKRLNLAHEWLSDHRMREMYDLTKLRRRHADVTFAHTPAGRPQQEYGAGSGAGTARSADHLRRVGPISIAPSAAVSAAVVALLLAAAVGSVALYRAPGSGALASGPNSSSTALAMGTSGTAGAGTAASGATWANSAAPTAGTSLAASEAPAYEADVPHECVATGGALSFGMAIDGNDTRVYFVQCGANATFGPLAYTRDFGRWRLVSEGRLERAVVVQAFAGSITGEPNEYSVVWSGDGGDTTWLVLYRFDGAVPSAFWNSYDHGLLWWLADFRYQAGVNNVRGAIVIRAAEPQSGRCERCRDHDMNLEVWEWSVNGNDGALTLSWEKSDGIGP